jgi:Ca2+/Na+ antiporter
VNYGVRGRLKSIISHCGVNHASKQVDCIFSFRCLLYLLVGCVVINHQKGRDCKENRPWVVWLNIFWCLMINIIYGLMYLLVFMIIVHMMLK